MQKLKNEKDINIRKIVRIRSDHGKEFQNTIFAKFCDKHGIAHEFSAPKTPKQNGVVERKNRTLQEMARVMLIQRSCLLDYGQKRLTLHVIPLIEFS